MASKLFNLFLNLSGQNSVPKIVIRQDDYDGTTFHVQVTQDGLPFDFTGFTPIFECLNADGVYVRDDGSQYGTFKNIDAQDGTFDYTLVNEVFSGVGNVSLAYFAFEQSNTDFENPTNRVSTGNFAFTVIANALEGNLPAASYFSDLTTLINEINQVKTDYQTLNPANYQTKIAKGTTAPATPQTGDYWFNEPTSGNVQMQQYDGSQWNVLHPETTEAQVLNLVNDLAAINTNLAAKVNNSDVIDTGWQTLPLENGAIGNASYRKVTIKGLSIVTIHTTLTVISTTSADQIALPSAIQPAGGDNNWLVVPSSVSDNSHIVIQRVGGAIRAYSDSSTLTSPSQSYSFNMTYVM